MYSKLWILMLNIKPIFIKGDSLKITEKSINSLWTLLHALSKNQCYLSNDAEKYDKLHANRTNVKFDERKRKRNEADRAERRKKYVDKDIAIV